MSVHELSEKSILKRKRVKQFQNAKVFPGLVGFHSEPNLRDVQISITKKNDLKTLAMKRKMSMSGDISSQGERNLFSWKLNFESGISSQLHKRHYSIFLDI